MVPDARDLAFIGHQRDQFELVAPADLLGQSDGLLRATHRGPPGPGPDPPVKVPPADIEFEAEPHCARLAAEH